MLLTAEQQATQPLLRAIKSYDSLPLHCWRRSRCRALALW
jgi:hypothetical protein